LCYDKMRRVCIVQVDREVTSLRTDDGSSPSTDFLKYRNKASAGFTSTLAFLIRVNLR
jgi:hypothetical protein